MSTPEEANQIPEDIDIFNIDKRGQVRTPPPITIMKRAIYISSNDLRINQDKLDKLDELLTQLINEIPSFAYESVWIRCI